MSPMRDDRLSLHAILCRVHIGVTDEERRERQKIEVDLDLRCDLEPAARSGDLRATLDYREVCEAVRGFLEDGRFHLVEAAAGGVADLVLTRFAARRVTVRLRKFVLPDVGHVEVELQRDREKEAR
ncbi:MAG TPA: dihydroneopterin aldolase [Candidatus Polarisedimenticolia bacterium]